MWLIKKTEADEQANCDHIRMYDEQALFSDNPQVIWKCMQCGLVRVSDKNIEELTYRYDQIRRG